MNKQPTPIILCLSGLDPTGGAGIQADIEAIAAQGCHAAPVITANTIQDTHTVFGFRGIDPELIIEQGRRLFDDMPIGAIKIGMLGSAASALAAATLMSEHPEVPVIYDPVLFSGDGSQLARDELLETVRSQVIPGCRLLTPNTIEARHLAGDELSAEQAARELSTQGKSANTQVLLTGTHSNTPDICHQLYSDGELVESFYYPRLPNEYHGSGCTLASSLAAQLARGEDMLSACQKALDYTFETLQQARQLGQGQWIPKRL